MSDSVDLRAAFLAFLVEDPEREAIEVTNAQAEVGVRPALLVLGEEVANPFVLDQERLGDQAAGVLRVVRGASPSSASAPG